MLVPVKLPRAIREFQCGSGIAGSAAKSGRHRDAFDQFDMSAEPAATSLLEQLERFSNEIIRAQWHNRRAASETNGPTCVNIEMNLTCSWRRGRCRSE